MKVLIIPSWFETAENPSAGVFVKEQAETLAAAGLEVGLIYSNLSYKSNFLQSRKITESQEGGYTRYQMDGFFPPKVNFQLIQKWATTFDPLFEKYQQQFGRPDVIHAHSFMAGVPAHYLAKKHKIPFVITEHSSDLLNNSLASRHRKILHEVYKEAAVVIAVSKALHKGIAQEIDCRAIVIPNVVDFDKFKRSKEKDLSSKKMQFISVGSLNAIKGYAFLIDAFADFIKEDKSAVLKIIGSGELHEKLEQLILAKGVQGQITLEGEKSQAEIIELLDESAVFISSSITETFGVAIVEALAMGKPVISTNSGGPAEIIDASNGLVIPVNDKRSMINVLRQISREIDQYDPATIRENAKLKYGKVEIGGRLIEIYTALMQQ